MKPTMIFDLDGTLLNSIPDIANAMNAALSHYGLPTHSLFDYRMKIGNGAHKLAERSVQNATDKVEQVFAYYTAEYASHCREESHLYDGIFEMLHTLSANDIDMCIFSNKNQADVEVVIAHYFPDIPFRILRGSMPHIPLKPHPQGALIIAEELNVSPENCYFVGDTPMDIHCGKNANMRTIGVTWGFRDRVILEQENADFLADTPQEVLSYLGV